MSDQTPGILSDVGVSQGQAPRGDTKGFARPDSPPSSTEYHAREGADARTMKRTELPKTGAVTERGPYDPGKSFDGGEHKPGLEKQRAQEKASKEARLSAGLSRTAREKSRLRAQREQLLEDANRIAKFEMDYHGRMTPTLHATLQEMQASENERSFKLWAADITEKVKASAKYEFTNRAGGSHEVAAYIREKLEKSGGQEKLTWEQAAAEVEAWYEKKYRDLSKTEKARRMWGDR